MKKKLERIMILIDGNNFYHGIKKILKPDEIINYQKLIDVVLENRELVNVSYYVAPLDKEIDYLKFKKHQKFLEDLEKIPKFKVVLCNFKRIKKSDGGFFYIVKGDDVQLAHDLLMGAFNDLYDTAIIISGDEDFFPLIGTIRKTFKKRVENAYFRGTSSYRLRNACNFSFNLNKFVSRFIDKK